MKYLSLFIIILPIIVNAEIFKLTKDDVDIISKAYDSKIINYRIADYKKFLNTAKTFSKYQKFERINYKVNKIRSMKDEQSQGVGDYWSSPKEFLIDGKGDCEDYAITKFFSLKDVGIDKTKLYLGVGKVKYSKTSHMVMLYFKTNTSIPIVLDNLSWKILPLNKRSDLTVQFVFNEIDSYTIKNNKKDQKVRINWGKKDKWKELLQKVYSN